MRRLPLLLIALFLFILTAGIVWIWVLYSMMPIQQQPGFVKYVMQSFLPIAFAGFAALGFIIWIWALVHMLTNRALQGADKIVWVLVIIFLNVLGAILYFAISPFVRLEQPKQQT